MGYKATPITYKAKQSPLKAADPVLVQGAADIGASKAFKDYSEGMAEKFDTGGYSSTETERAPGEGTQGAKDKADKEKADKEKEKETGGQADKAVDPETK